MLIENTDKLLTKDHASELNQMDHIRSPIMESFDYEDNKVMSKSIANDIKVCKTSRNDFRQRVEKLKNHINKRENYYNKYDKIYKCNE